MTVPGDAYVDPIIARGEELERILYGSERPMTAAESAELESIKAYARARLAHLAAYPLAASSIEESVRYLAEQKQRDCDAVAEVLRRLAVTYGPAAVEAAVAVVLAKR